MQKVIKCSQKFSFWCGARGHSITGSPITLRGAEVCFESVMIIDTVQKCVLDIQLYTDMSLYERGAEVCFENAMIMHIDIQLCTYAT